jgi:sugar phosphate permease
MTGDSMTGDSVTGVGPDHRDRQARVATAAGFAAQGLMFAVLLTHLPQFTDRYQVSEGTITLIVLMVLVLAGIGSLLSEVLAAATSSRTALRCGLLVVAAAGATIGLASEFVVLVAGFAVFGIGAGAVDAAVNMQGVAVQHRYGRSIITSFHAAWSGAAIIGALYVAGGERLSVSLPVSIVPIAVVVLAIAAVAGPYLLPLDELESDPAPPVESVRPKRSLSTTVRSPMFVLGLAMTCFWAVDSGVSNWSSLYLQDVLKADSSAALGYALYQAAGLVSRLFGDLAVQRLGAVFTVRAAAVVGTLGSVLVVLAPGPLVAIIGFGLAGAGLPMVAPLCFTAAGTLARARTLTGSVVSVSAANAAVDSAVARLNVFNYLGSLLGAVLIGGIATATDLRIGFIVPILLAATMFFLANAFAPAQTP